MNKKGKNILISVVVIMIVALFAILLICFENDSRLIINENGLNITVTDIAYKKDGLKVKLSISNSGKDDLFISSGTNGFNCNSVNGYMNNEGYLNTTVKAGSRKNAVLSFSRERLEMYGIKEVKQLQLGICVQNLDTRESTYFSPIKINVNEDAVIELKDTYSSYIQKSDELDYYEEKEMLNCGNVVVKSVAFISDKEGENKVLIEVVNNSSDIAYGSMSDITISSLMLPNNNGRENRINPNTTRIFEYNLSDDMEIPKSKLIGIDKIGEFKCNFSLKVGDKSEQTTINVVNPDVDNSMYKDGDELYNEKGIRIISKGICNDYVGNNDYGHILLLVENNTEDKIGITNKKFYMDFNNDNGGSHELELPKYWISAGNSMLIDIEFCIRWLEGTNEESVGYIENVEDVENVKIELRIFDKDNNVIAEPAIKIE